MSKNRAPALPAYDLAAAGPRRERIALFLFSAFSFQPSSFSFQLSALSLLFTHYHVSTRMQVSIFNKPQKFSAALLAAAAASSARQSGSAFRFSKS
jgi:hypothetical protein